jgi:hypothetical protein
VDNLLAFSSFQAWNVSAGEPLGFRMLKVSDDIFPSSWKVTGVASPWCPPYVVRKRVWVDVILREQTDLLVTSIGDLALIANMALAWVTNLWLRRHPLHLKVPLLRLLEGGPSFLQKLPPLRLPVPRLVKR